MPISAHRRRLVRAAGAATALLGAAVLIGWALDLDTLKRVVPAFAAMKANAALCFLLSGVALCLRTQSGPRLGNAADAATLLALTLALATLVEYGLGLDFGIDQLLFLDPATPPAFKPGRMGPGTAWGFAIAGIALALLPTATYSAAGAFFARAFAVGVFAIGTFSCLGYLFGLRFLVSALPFDTVALHTAIGFMLLGGGALAAIVPPHSSGEDRRIARLAAWLLALVAGAAGTAGFAIIGAQVHATLAQGLSFALDARIKTITINVALRTTRAEIVTTRPNLLRHLRLLLVNPDDIQALAVVQGVIDSFRGHGFSGISVTSSMGAELASSGSFIDAPQMVARLKDVTGEATLLWKDGLYLRHRLPLGDDQGALGAVVTQQFLPGLTEGMLIGDTSWDSAEFVLCQREALRFNCFPSRRTPAPFSHGPAPAGAPPGLVYRAEAEGAGFADALDYDLEHVLGAYGRVGGLGLVAALKVDAREIYAPTARRFALALALIALLSLLGARLVWLRVRPLAAALETRVRERTAELQQANEDLHHAAAERARLEARFRQVVEFSPSGMIMVDGAGRIVLINTRAEQMFGYHRDILLGEPVGRLLPERLRARIDAQGSGFFMQPEADSTGLTREVDGRRSDGAEFPLEVSLNPIETTDGVMMLASVVDISARKAAEQALRDSESKRLLSSVVEYSADGIVTLTLEGAITSWNRGATRIYGYTAEEVTGQHISLLAAEDHQDEETLILRRIARGERTEEYETKRRRKDARIIDASLTYSPIRDARGEIVGAAKIAREITERKTREMELAAAHAAIAASEAQLRALLESMQDGFFVAEDSRFVFANPALPAMLGYSFDDFVGRPFADVVAPEFLELWNERFRRRIAGGAQPSERYEVRFLRRVAGEVLWVELSVRSFQYRDKPAVLGIARDVTARKEAEEQLRALAKELARSNGELEDFARVASHDLQEPLRKVQAFGDLLAASSADLDEQSRDYLARMQDAARRMSVLITDLLAFSRVNARTQPFAKVDLAAVAREVVSDLEVRITQSGGGVALSNLPTLDADRLQMRQLLQNLIGNALKYRRPEVPPQVRVYGRMSTSGDEVRVYVADNGIGFDMKYLDRIFVVFQRLHGRGEYEGTGVGLAICKKIVERHRGHITAESVPGEGATFIATLPLRQKQAEV